MYDNINAVYILFFC